MDNRRVFATRERGHIDIAARDILNGRIVGLAKGQGIASVRNGFSADCDHDARRVRFDRNGMVRSRDLHWPVSHDVFCNRVERTSNRARSRSRGVGREQPTRTVEPRLKAPRT